MPSFNKNDFSGNPVRLDTARSKFSMPFKHKTTFSAGKLIPIFSYGDVMPGDTFKIDLSCLVRMTTPVFPTMDDAYLDVYFFFTPHKMTLSRAMMSPSVSDSTHSWAAFIGAQDSLLNMPTPSDIKLPFCFYHVTSGNRPEIGSLIDYLGCGLPVSSAHGISCLEPLAYYSVWNNYFRDENTMNPVVYSLGGPYSGSSSVDPGLAGRNYVLFSGFDGTSRWGAANNSIGFKGSVLPVCRPHGYFGSALPWPQRNLTQVEIPLLGTADVITGAERSTSTTYWASGLTPLKLRDINNGSTDDSLALGLDTGNVVVTGTSVATGSGQVPSNLYADLSTASGVSVNQLRLLVQTQRFYEALARGGNRIGEMTATMFGVTPSDYAQDRPEYLGGKRIPIAIDQVANTAGATAGSSGQTLGSLGAYSNTGDSSFYFEKSFDTWGTITCVCCVRTNETFSQGIQRRYYRKSRLDFYWPQFANLGEQPIYKKELLVADTAYDAHEDEVFGYQEAWAEYRYLPDIVSGYLRPGESLGAYTYANNFSSFPTLAGYLDGEKIAQNVDRTLVTPSKNWSTGVDVAGFQFIGDFSFNIVATRPMPRYSIPGLVDHH